MGYVNKTEIEESLFNIIKEKLNFKSDQEIDSYIKKLINWLVEDMYLIMNSKKPVDTYTKEEFDAIIKEIKPTIVAIADYYSKTDINTYISDLYNALDRKLSLGGNYPSNEEVKNIVNRILDIDVNSIDSYTKSEFDNKCKNLYFKDNMDNISSDNSVISVNKANKIHLLYLNFCDIYKNHLNSICNALTYVDIETPINSSLDLILENISKALAIEVTINDINITVNKLIDNLHISKLCVDDESNIYTENTNTMSIFDSNGVYKSSVEKINKIESDIFDYFSYNHNGKSSKIIIMYGSNKLYMYKILSNSEVGKIYYDSNHNNILSRGKSIYYEDNGPDNVKYGLICKNISDDGYTFVDKITIKNDTDAALSGNSLDIAIPSGVYKCSRNMYKLVMFDGNKVYVISQENGTHYSFTINDCSNIISIEPVSDNVCIVYDNKISKFNMILQEITKDIYTNACNFKHVVCSSDRIYAIDEDNNAIIYDVHYENNSIKVKIDDDIIGMYYDKKLDRALAYSQTSVYVIS